MGENDFLDAGFLSAEEAAELWKEGDFEEPETPPEKNSETETPATEGEPPAEPETKPEDNPESVSSEEIQGAKDTTPEGEGSPDYSSIAQAFQEVGVLQTLDKERLESVKTPEDLADVLEEEVHNRLDEHNKRIDEALKYKMPVPLVQQYEQIISTFDKITEEAIEDEANEKLRKDIIFRDLVNKGHSEDEAIELIEDYLSSGKDVDKAKKALESCKKFYKDHYDNARKEAKDAYDKEQAKAKKEAEALKTSIMEDDKVFKDLEINKAMRQKILEAVSKPVETLEDGTKLTAFQKYVKDNPVDFYKMAGMFFVLTEGFTKIDNLIKEPVKKEVRKGIDKLTNVLNSTSRDGKGAFTLRDTGPTETELGIDISQFKLG